MGSRPCLRPDLERPLKWRGAASRTGPDLILAFGGDGTINEVSEGVIGSQIPFGVLPGGTANVLCRELGMSNSPEAAAAQVGDWRPERIAAGVVCCAGTAPRHFHGHGGSWS